MTLFESARLTAHAWAVFGPRLIAEAVLSRVRFRAVHTPRRRTVVATRWGMEWSLNLADNLQRRLLFSHSYEAATLLQVARRMRVDDVIVDVGANIGTFLLPLLRHVAVQGRGLAVEPAADTVAVLEENVRRNGMAERVATARVALAEVDGLARLGNPREGHDDTGHRTLLAEADTGEVVSVRCGDELVHEAGFERIDVLKVDVEGSEYAVLVGLEQYLRRSPPRLLILELVEREARDSPGSGADIIAFLECLGYRGWWIRYRGLEELSQAPRRHGNALFMPVASR